MKPLSSALGSTSASSNLAQDCIDNIERILRERGASEPNHAQRHLIEHCLLRPGTRTRLRVKRPAEGLSHADPTI